MVGLPAARGQLGKSPATKVSKAQAFESPQACEVQADPQALEPPQAVQAQDPAPEATPQACQVRILRVSSGVPGAGSAGLGVSSGMPGAGSAGLRVSSGVPGAGQPCQVQA